MVGHQMEDLLALVGLFEKEKEEKKDDLFLFWF